jgi:hypothetical protein
VIKKKKKEREPATKHLIYLDVKGIRKETVKIKKLIRAFVLLDREM